MKTRKRSRNNRFYHQNRWINQIWNIKRWDKWPNLAIKWAEIKSNRPPWIWILMVALADSSYHRLKQRIRNKIWSDLLRMQRVKIWWHYLKRAVSKISSNSNPPKIIKQKKKLQKARLFKNPNRTWFSIWSNKMDKRGILVIIIPPSSINTTKQLMFLQCHLESRNKFLKM